MPKPEPVRIDVAALQLTQAPGGHRLARPVEDTRQLGADAIMADGIVRQLWRPRTPSGRPSAAHVVDTAANG